MRVNVLLFASAREAAGTAELTLDLPEGATVQEALDALVSVHPALAPLLPSCRTAVNEEFADLCVNGGFEQQNCCELELDEPELQRLPRLSFAFNGRNHGRLRELTDYINEPGNWARPLASED